MTGTRATAAILSCVILLGPHVATARSQATDEASNRSLERSEAAYLRGLEHFQEALAKEEPAQARVEFEKALERFLAGASESVPYLLAVHYAGVTLGKLNRPREAEPFLRRAVAMLEASGSPRLGLAEAVRDLGVTLYHDDRYREALVELTKAGQLAPGDAATGLYRGLCLLRLNEDLPTAVDLFQAAADNQPALAQAAAYYSGVARLRQRRFTEAREAFRQAASTPGDPRLAAAAERLSERTESFERGEGPGPEKRWALRFSIAGQYDSNVILQETDSAPGLGQITDQGDAALAVAAGGGFDLWRSPRGRLTAEYDFQGRVQKDLSEFDLQAHWPRLRAVWSPSARLSVGVQAGAPRYRLGGFDYLQKISIEPSMRFRFRPWAETRVFAMAAVQDFSASDQSAGQELRLFFSPNRDGVVLEAGGRQSFRLRHVGGAAFAGYLRRWERPDSSLGNEFRYSGHEVEAGFATTVLRDSGLEFRYAYRRDDYSIPNAFFQSPRQDRVHDFRAAFRKPLDRRWELDFTYAGIVHNSSIDVFEYRRQIGSMALRLTF